MNLQITSTVKDRYSAGAKEREADLCCPIDYNSRYLEIIPDEVIERDYGCGDPSKYVGEGETVLDLGSGGGKICFIAAQLVGEKGKVIGVDMTPDMLDLARRNAPIVAERLGYANVEFKRGHIQDLKTDMDLLDRWLAENPVCDAQSYEAMRAEITRIGKESPLVEDESVDVIVSNCVLNLVDDREKARLFAEMHRVLKRGGRIAVSDIVSDEPSPPHLKDDPELWSGCISGALQEHQFLRMLEEAGFYGIEIAEYADQPWRIVEGIEYRSMTVVAFKGKEGPCYDKNQAVIYRGPWKQVEDDDGHIYVRGQRMAVCEKTFNLVNRPPYSSQFVAVPPHKEIEELIEFDCARPAVREPAETKRGKAAVTTQAVDECCPDTSCC